MEDVLKAKLFTAKKFKAVVLDEKGLIPVDLDIYMRPLVRAGIMIDPRILTGMSRDDATLLIEELLNTYGISESELSTTFYNSFEQVQGMTRFELFIDQVIHYASTYGGETTLDTGFGMYLTHNDFVFKADALPGKLFTYIEGITVLELAKKVNTLLTSGIALATEDVEGLYNVIKSYNLDVDLDNIKNKEMMCRLALDLGKVPHNPAEFVRLLVYTATNNTLLIMNRETLEQVKHQKDTKLILTLLEQYIATYSIEQLASNYNRFKQVFLALKGTKELNKIINKLNKVSKYAHVPMKENVLGNVTKGIYTYPEIESALEHANVYQIIRALNAVQVHSSVRYIRSDLRLYTVRNGRTYIKRGVEANMPNTSVTRLNQVQCQLMMELLKRVEPKFKDKTFMIPANIDYAVPTSAKDFLNTLPNGTIIKASGDTVIGVHWEDKCDLDLSAVTAVGEHIGWNGQYGSEAITYSGDMTHPVKDYGATECMLVKDNARDDIILSVNNYSGDCNNYKLFVGSRKQIKYTDKTRQPILDTKNIEFIVGMGSLKTQTTLGCFVSSEDESYFMVTNQNLRVRNIVDTKEAQDLLGLLVNNYKQKLRLRDLIELCGGQVVTEVEEGSTPDYNLAPDALTLDTFMNLLTV